MIIECMYLVDLEARLLQQVCIGAQRLVHSAPEAVVENVAVLPADAEVFISFQ